LSATQEGLNSNEPDKKPEEAPPQPVDSDSSDDPSDTDSSSDEEASNVGRAARLVRCPTAPNGTSLIQHSKSKMLHLLADGYQRIFLCGRQRGESHRPPVQVRSHFEVKMLLGFGPLLEVQMSFRVAGARDCAPLQK